MTETPAPTTIEDTNRQTQAALAFAQQHLGENWPLVLDIEQKLAAGGSLPKLDNIDTIMDGLSENMPGGPRGRADITASNILDLWEPLLTTTAPTDDSDPTANLLAGIQAGGNSQQWIDQFLTVIKKTSEEGVSAFKEHSSHSTVALVLAVGPEYVPAETWAAITAVVSPEPDAEPEPEDTSATDDATEPAETAA